MIRIVDHRHATVARVFLLVLQVHQFQLDCHHWTVFDDFVCRLCDYDVMIKLFALNPPQTLLN